MAQFPGLTLWTDAWVADTFHLSHEEVGIYIRLLVLMWRTPGCQVPNDDQWLAKHFQMTPEEVVEKLRPLIKELCQNDANWVYQKRLKREFVRRFELGARQSVRAKSRWRKKKDTNSGNAANGIAASGNPSPSYPTPPKKASCSTSSSFPTAATAEQEKKPARSFATAPDEGALAREPDSAPAERKRSPRKKPETLAEINVLWRGNGRHP